MNGHRRRIFEGNARNPPDVLQHGKGIHQNAPSAIRPTQAANSPFENSSLDMERHLTAARACYSRCPIACTQAKMTRNDGKAENQHYVPRMLLRNFTFSKSYDKIHVFDKKKRQAFKANIKNVVTERNFYSFALKGKKGSLEPVLSKLEEAASVAICEVINQRSLSNLSDKDKAWIGLFIAAQHLRVRNFREMLKAFEKTVPIRLGQTSTTCRMRPLT